MTERTKDRIGIWAAVIISILVIGGVKVWSAAVQVPIKFHYGVTQDQIDVEVYAFNTLMGNWTVTDTDRVDTILSFGDDTLWQVVAYNSLSPDSTGTWTMQINRRASNGPVDWPVRMYWPEPSDSARVNFYKDSTVALTFGITGEQRMDSTFTVYRDTAYSVINDIYYTGQTKPVSWIFNVLWRRVDTGLLVQTPSATLSRLYGFVKLPNGQPAKGASVTISRGSSSNSVSTSATRYAITSDVLAIRTDTLGKFQADVVASSQFADTANAYYDVRCQWRSIELFNVRHIWAPAGQTVNVLDTLAGRL